MTDLTQTTAFIPRHEDPRLLSGQGEFTGDRLPPRTAHVAFVRSPHAHARIGAIDAARARSARGVIDVLTAADLAAAGIPPTEATVALKRPDGSAAAVTPRPLLVGDEVRHIGEPVAMVVAESAMDAIDAAELIDVEYEPLAPVMTCRAALAGEVAPVWEQFPDNIAFLWRGGDREAVARAIASASHVTRMRYALSRVAAAPIEPRVTLVEPAADGRMVVRSSTQTPYDLRDALAAVFGWPNDRVRVIAGDVGGSFGMKAGFFREDALVVWAASRLERPVCWASARSEAFLSDDQARDVEFEAALALDSDGTFVGLEVRYDVNVGAYFSIRSVGPVNNVGGVSGVYRTAAVAVDIYGVLTHTIPTAPYRGAGRPDATYALERLIDVAAFELGIDPVEIRRRNLIPADAMPYKTSFLFEYDCGDFPANLEEAAKLADVAGFAARRAEAARRGKLRGLGICNPIEPAGGPYGKPAPDSARVVVDEEGRVHCFTGGMSVGQGYETAFGLMVADRLGVPTDSVVYHQGDTDHLDHARGNGGSSGLCVSGSTVALAVDATIAAGRDIAAEQLEVASADLKYGKGEFTVVGTDRSVPLIAIARIAARRAVESEPIGDSRFARNLRASPSAVARSSQAAPTQAASIQTRSISGLSGAAIFQPQRVTFPNGCHMCEVEVDPDTGAVQVLGYVAVEDIGRVIHPTLAYGQIHGGVAQGMGQALYEKIVYDPEGQLLTGSFLDYAIPRAHDLPSLVISTREVPTAVNVLGAKGVGEAGTVGALAATMNAICNALAPVGVRHVEMPATPERIWRAIREAQESKFVVPDRSAAGA